MSDVFISFAVEEKQVALALKRVLEVLLPQRTTFLTADPLQLSAGERWLDRIENELRAAKAVIVLLSRRSVSRPWINFEAGAAWLNRAVLIPACIGDLNPGELPKPYNDLQAVRLQDDDDLYRLLRSVEHAAGAMLPPPPPVLSNESIDALRQELSNLLPLAGEKAPIALQQRLELSPDASVFLKKASESTTGRINRFNMDQALIIRIHEQNFSAQLGDGRRRAQFEAAIRELEAAGFIEDVSLGQRTEFEVTSSGLNSRMH